MKRLEDKKIILICILFLIVFAIIGIPNYVFGASASVSSSVTTMTVDESATITASVSSTEAWNLKLSTSGGNLSGTTSNADAAGEEVSKSVMTATFTASNPGSYTISLSGDVTGSDLSKQTVSTSTTINVIEKVQEQTTEPEQHSEQGVETSLTPSENNNSKPKSGDAELNSLTAQVNGKSIDISNNGSKYTTTVEADVSAVTFTVKANSSVASIDSNKSTSGLGFVKNSGSGAQKTYTMSNLQEGNNVIKITITAEDGTQRNYTFTVTKKVAENKEEIPEVPNIVEEENDKEDQKEEEEEKTIDDSFGLKTLVITGVELTPEFNTNIYMYTATIEGSDSVEVIAISTDEEAEVEIVGNTNLVAGENLITVIVKKDEEVKTYQIVLDKTEALATSTETSDDEALFLGLSWKHLSVILAGILIIIAVVIKLVFLSKSPVDNDYRNEADEDESKQSSKDDNIYYNDANSKKGKRFK